MQKEEILFAAGDQPEFVGVVPSGSVNIVQEDYWGRRAILAHIGEGELFGEAFPVLRPGRCRFRSSPGSKEAYC